MTFVSSAQNFEDVLLWRALNDVTEGKYLDIGAQDPVVDSVSLAFYNAGWRGVHVEPAPHYAAKLRDARPDETVIQALVTAAQGAVEFFEIPDTGLSTGKLEIARHHEAAGFAHRKQLVPCMPLHRLLELEAPFHWMKIDVEGMESEVLRSWGNSEARPWILLIESTFPNSQIPTHDMWIDEVVARGYREVFFDGLSRYFLHESQLDRKPAFDSPANVFDGFAIAKDHFAARPLQGELAAARDAIHERDVAASELTSRLSTIQQLLEQEQDKRTGLESELAEGRTQTELAERELAVARDRQAEAESKLAKVAGQYASSIESMSRESKAAEKALRREFEKTSGRLRQQLDRAKAAEALAKVETARLEERTNWLQEALTSAREERKAVEDDLRVRLTSAERGRDELRIELQHHHAALLSAESLIRTLQLESGGWWQRLGQRLGFSKVTSARDQLARWSGSLGNDSSAPSPILSNHGENRTVMRLSVPAAIRNPSVPAKSLSELLSWDDEDFVTAAYATILGREPDPEGIGYYTHRLRDGRSKLEMLWQLRLSPEGRRHDPLIAGLDRTLRIAAWARKPGIGWALRLLAGAESGNLADRRHRALVHQLSVLREEQLLHRRLLEQLSSEMRSSIAQPRVAAQTERLPGPRATQFAHDSHVSSLREAGRQNLGSRERYILDLLEAQA